MQIKKFVIIIIKDSVKSAVKLKEQKIISMYKYEHKLIFPHS